MKQLMINMKQQMTRMLSEKRKGFTGLTHVLFSLLILTILLYFRVPIISTLLQGWMMIILGTIVIIGASLIPDLDNPKNNGGSYATYTLGILGDIINIAMDIMSSIAYTLTATKHDRKRPPKTQHRMLWHCPLVIIPLIILLAFTIPDSPKTLYSLGLPGINYIFHVFVVTIAIFLGLGFAISKLKRFIPFYHLIMTALPLLTIALVALLPLATLRALTLLTAFGCLSHILGDMMTKGGCALWPIPTYHGKHCYMWWHYSFLGKLSLDTANSLIMTICNVIFGCCAIAMTVLLVMR